jgi:hypothetical protein
LRDRKVFNSGDTRPEAIVLQAATPLARHPPTAAVQYVKIGQSDVFPRSAGEKNDMPALIDTSQKVEYIIIFSLRKDNRIFGWV